MSNAQLQTFTFPANSRNVRVIDKNGEPWFALPDVLKAMDSKTLPHRAKDSIINGLGEGELSVLPLLDSRGVQQDTTITNEAGVWYLVMRSDTELGRQLRIWLFKKVLPSIRKTGSYSLQNNNNISTQLIETIKKTIEESIKEKVREEFEEEINSLKKSNEEVVESVQKIEYDKKHTIHPGFYTVTDIVDHLNKYYKVGTKGKKTNSTKLWEYLKNHSGMIKDSDKPYVPKIDHGFVVRAQSGEALKKENHGVYFTECGVTKILKDAVDKGHIE